jgi:uncharacterized protein (TIGR02246 family)
MMATENSRAADEAQIRRLIDDRVKAVHEKDVEAVLSEYAPDVVMFNLAPPLQTTGADRGNIENWFSGYQGAINCEIRNLNIATGDDVAFCHYLYRISGTLTDGKGVDMWVRATLCFRKIEGQWLIAHEHDSDPFDMQTFKALTDLKP